MKSITKKALEYKIISQARAKTKEKSEKFNCIKIKKLNSLKETMKNVKREVTDWHKIFATHLTDKRQHTKHIRDSCESIRQGKRSHRKRWSRRRNKHFPETETHRLINIWKNPNITRSYG